MDILAFGLDFTWSSGKTGNYLLKNAQDKSMLYSGTAYSCLLSNCIFHYFSRFPIDLAFHNLCEVYGKVCLFLQNGIRACLHACVRVGWWVGGGGGGRRGALCGVSCVCIYVSV